MPITDENKIAFMTCIEVALMRRNNVDYNTVVCKLDAKYQCSILDCYDRPEPLKAVLMEVYKGAYDSVLDAIELELEKLVDVDEEKENFLKFMRN